MTKTKVLVVYPYLQHYRLGVFQEMDRNDEIEYTFVSDVTGRHGIEPLPASVVDRHMLAPRKKIGPFYWQRGLLSILAKSKYDAVIFFAEIPALSTWAGTILARLQRKPVLFWTTGWHRPEKGIKRLGRNFFYHMSNMLLLYGELGKSIGQKMQFPSKKMTVIGNSVEAASTEDRKEESLVYDKSSDELIIGAVIRLTGVKRLDLIIQAAALLKKEKTLPRIVVLIVGEGAERDKLKKLAAELGVDLVMPGAFYGKSALDQVYKNLDITVVPAAVGLTAIQSMSHGVPVVSNDSAYTQMPEWESIRPGVTGELFAEDDVDSLAAAIKRIAVLSTEERTAMSENCKIEVKQNWTAEAHAKRIATAINEIVANRYSDLERLV